ncbi:MAG: aminopeptidase, partial [Trichodesmium sp. St18_bin1]|nr:aminopeptidase [Trichodesmium sp. St18_bin1]
MSSIYFDSENNSRSFELPGARPHYNPDRPGQVEHIFLDLELDIPNKSFQSVCIITLNPVRSGIEKLTLDAVNLEIKSVKIEDIEQTFDYDGKQLQIYLQVPTTVGQLIKVAIA